MQLKGLLRGDQQQVQLLVMGHWHGQQLWTSAGLHV